MKASHSYDVLEMSGSHAVWPEVLAIYAVKTTTNPLGAQEVATIDDSQKSDSQKTFLADEQDFLPHRDENGNRYRGKRRRPREHCGNGNHTVTRTYLYVTVSHKTAEKMAAQYGFNATSVSSLPNCWPMRTIPCGRRCFTEFAAATARSSPWRSRRSAMWAVSLIGVGTVLGGRVEWCACFVSWCGAQCGYIKAGVIHQYAGCVWGVQWFQERGLWQDNSYEPRPGNIIFFDWDDGGQDGESDHSGIVV